jgi:hypothetical protein
MTCEVHDLGSKPGCSDCDRNNEMRALRRERDVEARASHVNFHEMALAVARAEVAETELARLREAYSRAEASIDRKKALIDLTSKRYADAVMALRDAFTAHAVSECVYTNGCVDLALCKCSLWHEGRKALGVALIRDVTSDK